MTVLILGIGSPFADDEAGWLVANQLSHLKSLQNKIISGELVIEIADRPGIDLLIWLQQGYEQIILIDMVKTNLHETGNIYKLHANEIIGFSGMLSSHNLGVSPSLALAQALGMNINHICFWGIEGRLFRPEDKMSEQMKLACGELVPQLETYILHTIVL